MLMSWKKKKLLALIYLILFSIVRMIIFKRTKMFDRRHESKQNIVYNIQNSTTVFNNRTLVKDIHDPVQLRKNPIKVSCRLDKPRLCAKIGSSNATEGSAYPEIQRIRDHIESTPKKSDIKLFCAIYSYSGNSKFTDAQRETWAYKCDGYFISSDVTNYTTGHFKLPSRSRHGYRYKGMIQRLGTMYAFIYDHFLEQYDYFHFCGDDTYVIVENLKEFLTSKGVQQWEEDGNYFAGGFWAHW